MKNKTLKTIIGISACVLILPLCLSILLKLGTPPQDITEEPTVNVPTQDVTEEPTDKDDVVNLVGWHQVLDLNQLNDGDKITFISNNEKENIMLGDYNAEAKRYNPVKCSYIQNENIGTLYTADTNGNYFQLSISENGYSFIDDGKYLTSAYSSSNTCKLGDVLNEYSTFTIEFIDGLSICKSYGDKTCNTLKYSSSYFSLYPYNSSNFPLMLKWYGNNEPIFDNIAKVQLQPIFKEYYLDDSTDLKNSELNGYIRTTGLSYGDQIICYFNDGYIINENNKYLNLSGNVEKIYRIKLSVKLVNLENEIVISNFFDTTSSEGLINLDEDGSFEYHGVLLEDYIGQEIEYIKFQVYVQNNEHNIGIFNLNGMVFDENGTFTYFKN